MLVLRGSLLSWTKYAGGGDFTFGPQNIEAGSRKNTSFLYLFHPNPFLLNDWAEKGSCRVGPSSCGAKVGHTYEYPMLD